jgi:putative methyltransferase (TIGR04325 family)
VLAYLVRAGINNDALLSVLDFGGSLGTSYYQNIRFLKQAGIQQIEWSVVEQEKFVRRGKSSFENGALKFYYDISECLEERSPNVILLSGVLQYLEKPYDLIAEICALHCPLIIVSRTAFVEGESEVITVQNVPNSVYQASYPHRFFNYPAFISSFRGYKLIDHSSCEIDGSYLYKDSISCSWKDMIFKLE